MSFKHKDSGIAAAVFLALYAIILPLATLILRQRGWRSIYLAIWLFALFRLSSQLCGVVFATLGFKHWQWLIAYLILGVEGYFVLIITSLRLVMHSQQRVFGKSWLEGGPRGTPTKTRLRLGALLGLFLQRRPSWILIYEFVLIPANTLLIAGGSMMAGVSAEELAAGNNSQFQTSKALRIAGQAIFLALTVIFILIALFAYFKEGVRNWTLYSVLIASPFLVVRGVFGVLSIVIKEMNYFNMSNYGSSGISRNLVIYEYVLSTSMETIAMFALVSNYWDKGYALDKKDAVSSDSSQTDKV